MGWDRTLERKGGTYIRETEKPKVSGCEAKRRLRIVDLPEPEGPDMTIGREVLGAGSRSSC